MSNAIKVCNVSLQPEIKHLIGQGVRKPDLPPGNQWTKSVPGTDEARGAWPLSGPRCSNGHNRRTPLPAAMSSACRCRSASLARCSSICRCFTSGITVPCSDTQIPVCCKAHTK
eukprot:1138119-Pelagomonas_calceolata.AAC.12